MGIISAVDWYIDGKRTMTNYTLIDSKCRDINELAKLIRDYEKFGFDNFEGGEIT